MTDRKPLIPLNEEDRRRLQGARGLDADNIPFTARLTPAERLAADNPGLPAPPPEQPMQKLPTWLTAVLGVLVPVLFVLQGILPPPFGLVAYIVAAVAALVVGANVQPPKFLAGKPLVGGSWAVAFGSIGGVLVALSTSLQPGLAKSAVELGVILCAGLTGSPLAFAAKPAEAAPAPGAPQG